MSDPLSKKTIPDVPASARWNSGSPAVSSQNTAGCKTHPLVKVITLLGLIIFGLVIDLGGGPNKEFIGGRYWRDEPFNDRFMGLMPVSKARFLGFWAVFTKAAFSYG